MLARQVLLFELDGRKYLRKEFSVITSLLLSLSVYYCAIWVFRDMVVNHRGKPLVFRELTFYRER
jgi:hypothetical protein